MSTRWAPASSAAWRRSGRSSRLASYRTSSRPSSRPAAARSTSPSPLPATRRGWAARRRADDRRRVGHAERRDRRCVRLVVGQPEGLLVEERELGDRAVGRRRAVGHRRVEAGRRGDRRPGGAGSGREVALVLQVVAGDDLAGRDQPGERGERRRLEPTFLEPALVGDQQVGALRRAPRHQLAGDVGAVGQAGRDRVDRAAPAVRGEVDARELVHPGRGVTAEGLDRVLVGRRHLFGPEQVVRVEASGEQRREVEGDEGGGAEGDGQREPGEPGAHGVDAGTEQQGPAEGDEGHRPRRRTHGQAGGRAHEGLHQAAEHARVVVRMGTDGDGHADHHEGDGVEPVRPANGGRHQQGQRRDGVADHDQPRRGHVRPARLHPRVHLVAAVEEPVAEATQDLRGGGGVGDRPVALGVLEDREAVGALDPQAHDPPQRHAERQQPDARRAGDGSGPRHLAGHPHRVGEPQERADAGQQERRRVHAPDGQRDEGEHRRPAPAARAAGRAPCRRSATATPAQGSRITDRRAA